MGTAKHPEPNPGYVPLDPAQARHLRAVQVTENGLSEQSRIAAGDTVILDIERAPQDGDAVCVTLPARRWRDAVQALLA